LLQNKGVSMTLFAFDKGEAIATHTSGGDALVYLLDGRADVTIGDDKFELTKGETIVMPSGIPHSLDAVEKFKMLLIVGM
jgi:quercetin dioxygenase-like cupin family protein